VIVKHGHDVIDLFQLLRFKNNRASARLFFTQSLHLLTNSTLLFTP